MTSLPNPFFAPAEGVVPAGETSPPLPTSPVGTDNSVSDGEVSRSLPSGEIEPSVTLACPPPESRFEPAFQPDFEKLFNEIMGQQS